MNIKDCVKLVRTVEMY